MPAKYVILIYSILLVCCWEYPTYPEGGYAYPQNIVAQDSNLYFYQLKDISPPGDAFLYGTAWLYYKPFNEPNLSIKQQPKETFRLSYFDAFGSGMIITFNKDSIVVKKGNPMVFYNLDDTSRLSGIEKVHIRILRKWFPIDTTNLRPKTIRYLDSMIKLYPELLDATYFHKLYYKAISYSGEKFDPVTTQFSITKKQYSSLIQDINSAGFWTLPHKIECNISMTDGYGFWLEANTRARYKIVIVAGCPNDTSKFTSACQKIIELAKQDKRYDLISDESTGSVDTVVVQDVELEQIKQK